MVKMNKVLTRGMIGVALAIGFTGCVTEKPLPPKQIKSTKTDSISVNYTFNDELSNEKISKQNIKSSLIDAMSKKSIYRKRSRRGKIMESGYNLNNKNNGIEIQYYNGYRGGNDRHTNVTFKIPFNINEQSSNNFTVKSNFPTTFEVRPFTDMFGVEFKPYAKFTKLERDVERMFNTIKTVNLKRSYRFKGEINTNYPMKSVYANLKRNFHEYIDVRSRSLSTDERITPDKMKNRFYINEYKDETYFEVFPYKNGSKVVYTATIPYTIDSKGNSTLSKKDIDFMHEKIAKIIND